MVLYTSWWANFNTNDDWNTIAAIHLYIILPICYLYVIVMIALILLVLGVYVSARVFSKDEETAEQWRNNSTLRSMVVRSIFPTETIKQSSTDVLAQYCGGDNGCDSGGDSGNSASSKSTVMEKLRRGRDAAAVSSCCPICLEEFGDGCVVATSLCSHKFHHSCIIEWMMSEHQINKSDCPVCRQNMWKSERYVTLQRQAAQQLLQEDRKWPTTTRRRRAATA